MDTASPIDDLANQWQRRARRLFADAEGSDEAEKKAMEYVPLDQDAECVGCGDAKRQRGELAESLVCCHKCWRRLPKWVKTGFIDDHSRGMVWQNRISVLL